MTAFEIRIQSHIADARLKEAIDDFVSTLDLCNELMPQAADDVKTLRNQLMLQAATLRKLVKDEVANIIDPQEANRTRAKLNHALLNLLTDLPQQYEKFYDFVQARYQAQHASTALTGEQLQTIERLRQSDTVALLYDVFVSYSSTDNAFVLPLCNSLRQHNLNVFVAAQNLADTAGTFFSVKITNALRQSRHFVLVCSPAAMTSQWVEWEYQTFFNLYHMNSRRERRMIVLQGPQYNIKLVPDMLQSMQVAATTDQLITALMGQNALQSLAQIQQAIADEEQQRQAEASLQWEREKQLQAERMQQLENERLLMQQQMEREKQRLKAEYDEELRAQREANERIEQQRREIEQQQQALQAEKEATFKRLQDLEASRKAQEEADRKAKEEADRLEQQRRDERERASLLEKQEADRKAEEKRQREIEILLSAKEQAALLEQQQKEQKEQKEHQAFWNQISGTNTIDAYIRYQTRYPQGEYFAEANIRIQGLRNAQIAEQERQERAALLEQQRKAEQERIALLEQQKKDEQQRRDEPSGASLLEKKEKETTFERLQDLEASKKTKTPENPTLSGATHADRSGTKTNTKTKYIAIAAVALVVVILFIWKPWEYKPDNAALSIAIEKDK